MREQVGRDQHLLIGAGNVLRQPGLPRQVEAVANMRRFGGEQVRNAGTIGGNIANGSPIGDLPPALIALGATLVLARARHCEERSDEAIQGTGRALTRSPGLLRFARNDGERPSACEVSRLIHRIARRC